MKAGETPAAFPLVSPSEELPATDDEPTVTIRFACQGQDQAEFESLAADFHDQYPSIRVEVLAVEGVIDFEDWQARTFQLMSTADTAYYLVDSHAMSKGLLRDLKPFIEADPTFEADDFFPEMLEAFTWHQGTWALPSQAQLGLLHYARVIFDQAGIANPTLAWTRDEFLVAAQQLTKRRGVDVIRYGFVDFGDSGRDAFVLALADDPVVGQPLDAPGVVDVVRWYTDLTLHYGVMAVPGVGQASSERMHELLTTGRAAMWSYPFWSGYDREHVGIVPYPADDGDALVPAFMYGFMMSAGTQHPHESWLWLRYLSRQRLWGPGDILADRLPARRSVAEQSRFWDRFDTETATVLRYAAEHLFFAETTGEQVLQLNKAISAVFGGEPVEQALAKAQATLEEQLAQAAQTTPVPIVVATPGPQGPAGAVAINFAPPPGVDAATYRALGNTFNQSHSDVQVQLVTPDQARTADCFASIRSIGDAGSRAELLDLQPLLDADPSFSLDDFFPRFLDAFRFQGDLWGIPTQAEVRVVFYNRALFNAAGVPYPVPGWTLDELLTRAVALTRGDGAEKQYGFLSLNGSASDLQLFIALQGASLWDEQGRPDFDAPDVVAAVQWYADLAVKHGAMPVFANDLPQPDPAAQEARNALVRTGQVAMWTDFAGFDRSGTWPTDAQVGMAPLPVGVEGVGELLYEGLFIANDTPNVSACWEWLKVVSGQAGLVRGLPARRSLLESRGFADQVGREVTETYRVSLEYAELHRPATFEIGAQTYLLYQAFADILAGEPAGIALAKAQQEAQE